MEPASEIECSVCGRDGGPIESCDMCRGNKTFIAKRTFTLTEERRGMNPEGNKRRYGLTGDTSPKIVHVPGSR